MTENGHELYFRTTTLINRKINKRDHLISLVTTTADKMNFLEEGTVRKSKVSLAFPI